MGLMDEGRSEEGSVTVLGWLVSWEELKGEKRRGKARRVVMRTDRQGGETSDFWAGRQGKEWKAEWSALMKLRRDRGKVLGQRFIHICTHPHAHTHTYAYA